MYEPSNRAGWVIWPTVVLLLAAWVWICPNSPSPAVLAARQTTAPEKNLRFATPTIRLGEIRAGVSLASQFTFTNTGPHIVQLLEVRPGCGCLKPKLTGRTFTPGQQGVVPLEVQTLGQSAGPHTWQLTVLYRDGTQTHEQILQVIAHVVTEVSVQPATATLFTERAARHEIIVTDLRAERLRILRVESTSPHMRAEAGPFASNSLGFFTSKIAVHIDGELPAGRHEEQLVIYTNDPLYHELRVALTIIKGKTGQ